VANLIKEYIVKNEKTQEDKKETGSEFCEPDLFSPEFVYCGRFYSPVRGCKHDYKRSDKTDVVDN